ncbi:MAG: VOC family protein [Candidatus Bathyarchaeota archaeon]|nr:VOC family protein [Candidatus Bathyarchaeota archaeon]
MIKKIHHIGVAVKDLDASIKLFKEIFNLSASPIIEMKERKTRIAFLDSGRNEIFELIQRATPVREGFLHVCLPVENVEEAIVALKKKGVEILGPPRIGAHGVKIVFLDPKTTKGLPIELIEQHG